MVDDISAFDQLKTVADIGRALLPLVREAKSKGLDAQSADALNSKIAEMQGAVLDAQNDALASQQVQSKQTTKIRELEQTIAEFEGWESEKERYKLVNAGPHAAFVYLLRQEAAQEDEPLHYICPRCYNNRIKSIIQRTGVNGRMRTVCLECKSTFQIDFEIARSHGAFR